MNMTLYRNVFKTLSIVEGDLDEWPKWCETDLLRGAMVEDDEAAAILGVPIVTLRRAIERNARRGADSSVLSKTDGVHGRKCGRRWRVVLDAQWLTPLESGRQ
jgi:hypothetical protein